MPFDLIKRWSLLLTVVGLLLLAGQYSSAAQIASTPYQVFLQTGDNDRLLFVNMQTGEAEEQTVNGRGYTLLPNGVLYQDENNEVLFAAPGETPRAHPFIQPPEDTRRVDWTVSPDGVYIAWTVTTGTPTALSTETFISETARNTAKQVFADGPYDGIRAYPLAFDALGTTLYLDYQPDTIADLTPFRQYAALFSLNTTTGETQSLPGEPGCFCGGAVGGGQFVRLALAPTGFDVRVTDLELGSSVVIPSLGLGEYTQNGDVLIAPDGALAAYALGAISGFGTPAQTASTIIAIVDITAGTQRTLAQPFDRLLRPIAFTEGDTALLLLDPNSGELFKAMLTGSGSLELVAEAQPLGMITAP